MCKMTRRLMKHSLPNYQLNLANVYKKKYWSLLYTLNVMQFLLKIVFLNLFLESFLSTLTIGCSTSSRAILVT